MFSHPADLLGLSQIHRVRPHWVELRLARDALGMASRELLHAGPPLQDPGDACAPVVNSIVSAILFEGWAKDAQEARHLYRSGEVHLRPAQDSGCLVPLADVLSPSMWVQQISDAAGLGQDRFSPLNAGMIHPQRVGVFNGQVVEHLRWLNGRLANSLQTALKSTSPHGVDLLAVADQALKGGDDLHANNARASSVLFALLEPGLSGDHGEEVKTFLRDAAPFFLNLWMAACSCMLSAAREIRDCAIVTAAGGNGQHFGVQVAAAPGRWWIAPSVPPTPLEAPSRGVCLPAIGDSAVVDLAGFGAMTTLTQPGRSVPFASLWPDKVNVASLLLGSSHPALTLTQARCGTSSRQVTACGQSPIVALGILDANGQLGRIAGGFFASPMSVFEKAVAEMTR